MPSALSKTRNWFTHPGSAPQLVQGEFEHSVLLHDDLPQGELVRASWQRSRSLELDPDALVAEPSLTFGQLRRLRDDHPLAAVLPVVHSLLIRHAVDAGLVVAVSDEFGRLLWLDGDRVLRRQVEAMNFVEGADWSEAHAGTNAPGLALALDRAVQIRGPEHFNRLALAWSCTAVPVHAPDGRVIGVIDITGGTDAVARQTLPLVQASVAALQAELRINALTLAPSLAPASRGTVPHKTRPAVMRLAATPSAAVAVAVPLHKAGPVALSVLGTDHGRLESGDRSIEIRPRHAEILTLLAWYPGGLSAERLASLLHEQTSSLDTLRSEMVRLRKALDRLSPRIVISSQPYRLESAVDLDAQRVLTLLERGAHRVALAAYRGPLLPRSIAPGIVEIRAEVSARLRESLLSDASVDLLLTYARTDEARYDEEVWRACLELLPAHSPKRASIVARLASIQVEIAGR
ncbi:helix-turn-helix domain-containing protein [Cryobacterium frigoriphilum]|nr:helix-turn-helix domain-containing protein [Cryobacterium frigoriphilum]